MTPVILILITLASAPAVITGFQQRGRSHPNDKSFARRKFKNCGPFPTTDNTCRSNRNTISPTLLPRLGASKSNEKGIEEDRVTMNGAVQIPRAAVAISVRFRPATFSETASPTLYALVQRGNEPNKGSWSLPGGKIEWGETTIRAAKRELWEETKLPEDYSVLPISDVVKWHTLGPFTSTDSIHDVFHYTIAQCFAEINPDLKLTEPPPLIACDDAMDAKWWTLKEIVRGVDEKKVHPGVHQVLRRAEVLYQNGLLTCE